MKTCKYFSLLTVILTLISASTGLGAGTVRWTGTTSTQWSTSTNWAVVSGTPSTPPSSADDVEIGSGAITNQPTINSTTGAVTINTLTFGTSASGTLTFTAGSTGSLTINGNLSIAPANNT